MQSVGVKQINQRSQLEWKHIAKGPAVFTTIYQRSKHDQLRLRNIENWENTAIHVPHGVCVQCSLRRWTHQVRNVDIGSHGTTRNCHTSALQIDAHPCTCTRFSGLSAFIGSILRLLALTAVAQTIYHTVVRRVYQMITCFLQFFKRDICNMIICLA